MAESAAGSGAESAGTSSKGAPSAKPCPYAVPEHTLIRCIGQGSYGEVWLARNSFGTCRAVKIIACPSAERQRWADRELAGLKRFEPVSRSHAGLVDILQVGREAAGEYFYYVMELGDDAATGQEIRPEQYEPKTLASDILQSGRLPIQQCLKLGLSLSGAMAHLHQHGLLHRDIKPSNIIFVNEVPKLADIGLVAAVAEAHSYVGTTGFIPPEGPVSPQADIYALGKVLYEMSTGNDRNDFPALPPDLHTFADVEEFHEFNEIVLRACQDDPKRRYASATDLEADLQVLAVGKSVKRLRRLERQVALFKRVAIGAAVVGLVGGGLFYEWQRERAHAAEQRQRQVGSLLAEGTYALNGGDLLQSLPSFVEALRLEADNPAAVAAHRLRLGTLLDQCPTLTHVWFAKRDISQACFSPNGKWGLLAVLWGQVQVWDLATGEARSPPFGSAHLETAHFSPDGQRVVTAGQDTAATVWKLPAGEALLRLPHPHFARHAQFSPDGKWIATACADGAARIWKAATAELVRTLPAHSNVVFQVAFSPDGQWLATASRDQNACLWETATGARHGPVLRHGSWVYHAAFSPDGRWLVTACFDRKVRLWNVRTGEELPPPLLHGDGVRSAEFSPDGRWLVTACLDGTVRLWDAHTHQPLRTHPVLRHSGRAYFASFGPDGRRLITACSDGTARIWDLAGASVAAREIHPVVISEKGHVGFQRARALELQDLNADHLPPVQLALPASNCDVSLSGNGHFVATGYPITNASDRANQIVQVWNALNGQAFSTPIPLTNAFPSRTVSADGQRLACYGSNALHLLDTATGRPLLAALQLPEPVTQVEFSPDNHLMLTVAGSTVQRWDAVTGAAQGEALSHSGTVSTVRCSPDGRWFVSCTAANGFVPGEAQIWDSRTGERRGPVLAHTDGILTAVFSPDGGRIVTTSQDFTAIVWDTATGQPLTPPLAHPDQVRDAFFSANGQWIATACVDRTARIWDLATGLPLTPPLEHPTPYVSVQFVDQDRRLLTKRITDTAWLWPLPRDQHTLADLKPIAELLTGTCPLPLNTSAAAKQAHLQRQWHTMKESCPTDFTVTEAEIIAWHEQQAWLSEAEGQWTAVRFHLERLLRYRPNHPEWGRRLNAAERVQKQP